MIEDITVVIAIEEKEVIKKNFWRDTETLFPICGISTLERHLMN